MPTTFPASIGPRDRGTRLKDSGMDANPSAPDFATAVGSSIVCFHAGPPGSVMIGAMTFTSCAMQAIRTTWLLRMKVLRISPTRELRLSAIIDGEGAVLEARRGVVGVFLPALCGGYWSTEDHDAKQLAEVIADFAKWARSRAVAQ